MENIWMASDFNGAFAQIVTAPIPEISPVECVWSNADPTTIPFAYATAETMRHLAGCSASDDVFVTVASGGVGCSAVIQLKTPWYSCDGADKPLKGQGSDLPWCR